MSNRLSQEKADKIASVYCTNGYKKTEALLTVGYSETYAKSGLGSKLYDNILIKRAIAGLQAKLAQKTTYTQEIGLAKLLHAYDVAEAHHQPAAMVSAIIGANRMHGYDKDAGQGEKTIIIISPKAPKVVESKVVDVNGSG